MLLSVSPFVYFKLICKLIDISQTLTRILMKGCAQSWTLGFNQEGMKRSHLVGIFLIKWIDHSWTPYRRASNSMVGSSQYFWRGLPELGSKYVGSNAIIPRVGSKSYLLSHFPISSLIGCGSEQLRAMTVSSFKHLFRLSANWFPRYNASSNWV